MKLRLMMAAVLLILIGLPSLTHADYLIVSRSATIKTAPQGDASIIERAEPDVALALLDDGSQTNGYYKVTAPSSGADGWIYRTLVRRYPGDISEAEAGASPEDETATSPDGLTDAQRQYAVRHLRLGKPLAIHERFREGYVTAADVRLKIPVWVQYELSPADLSGPADRAGKDFTADTSIPAGSRAERDDYRGSGYDQGHMAPAADMVRSWSVMDESFLLSNAAPQVGIGFNRHIWSYLERAVRGWVEQRGALTVITGPIFAVENDTVKYEVVGESHVAVPTGFFKIVVDANDSGNIQALAFNLPNESLSGRDYSEFLTSIDNIEILTGLDFLSALPDDVENALEAQTATSVW
jgi:endonuclease G